MTDEGTFPKQRRNLILISLLLLFYKIGDLKIEKINILGNETIIGNHSVVPISLVVFFTYFFWRYYTYCRKETGVQNFFVAVDRAYRERFKEIASKYYSEKSGLISNHEFFVHISDNDQYKPSHVIDLTKADTELQKKVKKLNDADLFQFNSFDKFVVYIRALVFCIFNGAEFSEYVFPHILAVAAILVFCGERIYKMILAIGFQ